MSNGINFQYYRVDRSGKITKFSITGYKGIEPSELIDLKNSEVRQWASFFKKEIEQFFTLSIDEARISSNYIKNTLV